MNIFRKGINWQLLIEYLGKQNFETLDGREVRHPHRSTEDMTADLLELVCETTGGQHTQGAGPEG